MDIKFYYCYSCKLKDFLKSQGFRYITKGLHPKSGRPFFMFERTDDFHSSLVRWNEIKR